MTKHTNVPGTTLDFELRSADVTTYNIPADNLGMLLRKLKALKKRIDKLGLGEDTLTWTAGDSFPVNKKSALGRDYVITYTPITVSTVGDIALPGGWHLVAVLDHSSGTDTPIILSVPGEELPHEYRAAGPDCDHCKSKRRRNTTIIIRDEQPAAHADHYKQIGSTCVADYLGHKDAHAIASGFQYLAEFIAGMADEEGMFYRRPKGAWELDHCLSFVSACIRKRGWAPRSAGGYATADEAWEWFDRDFQPYTPKKSPTVYPPTVEAVDTELTTKAIEWLQAEDPAKAKSDYIYNIQTIARAPVVTRKTIGLAASIIGSYKKNVERELRYAAERKAKSEANGGRESEWVGEEKERLRKLEILVLGTYETEGDYGLSTRVVFKNAIGDDFVWFASGSVELEAGESYLVDATVKRHNEFKGNKQTQVNRLRVVG